MESAIGRAYEQSDRRRGRGKGKGGQIVEDEENGEQRAAEGKKKKHWKMMMERSKMLLTNLIESKKFTMKPEHPYWKRHRGKLTDEGR